jgi:hypothetical protein
MMDEQLTFVGKIWYVCIRPKEFFKFIDSEDNLLNSVLFFVLILLATLPLNFLVTGWLNSSLDLAILPGMMINLLMGLILTFILLPFYHLFVYIFGGRNGIKKSIQVFLYSAIPTVLVSWIPLLPLIVVFYSVYVAIVGLKILHNMSTLRAALAYLLPFLLLIIFTLISVITRV